MSHMHVHILYMYTYILYMYIIMVRTAMIDIEATYNTRTVISTWSITRAS